MQVEILMIIFNIVFFIHNLFFMKLLERIFGTKSSNVKIFFFSLTSGTVGTVFLIFFGSMSSLGYLIMLGVYLITVILYTNGHSPLLKVTAVLIFNIHIMVTRAIITSVISMVTGITILELCIYEIPFWSVLILTSMCSTLLTAGMLYIIPEKYLKSMGQKTAQVRLYIIIATLANIYLIANGMVYIVDVQVPNLPLHQIIAAVTWLLVTYSGIFMLVGFDMLRESKNRLETKIEKDRVYKDALINHVQTVIEINCSKNLLLKVVENDTREVLSGLEKSQGKDLKYTEYSVKRIDAIVHPEDKEYVLYYESLNNILNQYESGNTKFDYEYRILQADNSYRWVRDFFSIKRKEEGDIVAIKTTVDDIHEMKIQEAKLRIGIEKDPLLSTLYNRKTTEELIKTHLEDGKDGVVMLIDLDNFKGINDSFGHAYGDQVLKEASGSIERYCRGDDIVGRLGGDEFIVFLKGKIPNSEIKKKADNICKAIFSEHKTSEGKNVILSCCIGIAIAYKDGDSYKELYENSDKAMYVCKDSGKNNYAFYENVENKLSKQL